MQVYFYDNDKYFTNTRLATEEELLELDNFTSIEIPNGLYRPKFTGETWIEGADADELIKSMITYDLTTIGITDIIMIVGAYLKGGEDVFFKVLLNFWIEGKIDSNYLDNAVQFKIITKEEADFIRLTPKVEA